MPTSYSYDINRAAVLLLPPDKRMPYVIQFVRALLRPAQWLRDLLLGSYREGSTAPQWNTGMTYAKYAQVQYNKSVYESLTDNNTANPPTDSRYWMQVQVNFVGVEQRVFFNSQKVVFEFALNKWFGTNFRQPGSGISDIYISRNNAINRPIFIAGLTEADSSKVGAAGSSEYVGTTYSFGQVANMFIHIPVAVYNALDPSGVNNENIVRNFVDQYNAAGIIYSIVTY